MPYLVGRLSHSPYKALGASPSFDYKTKGGFSMAKDQRFDVIYNQSTLSNGTTAIYVNRETGVHYLTITSGMGSGVIPLLDSEGKPIINKNAR